MVCQLAAVPRPARAPLVLAYRFEAGSSSTPSPSTGPRYTVGPSTAFMALAAHPAVTPDHFASFEVISSGGARCRPRWWRSSGPASARTSATATGSPSAPRPAPPYRPSREAPVDPASGTLAVGVPGPDTVVRIVDDHGRECPSASRARSRSRGPQVVPGYWRLPGGHRRARFPDGELRTGDIGFMDAEGWLYVVDRKKDMINASGFKVWPREVEDVLYTHPAVREAAVVGVPDGYRGETVKAYISLRPGQRWTPTRSPRTARSDWPRYKYPRQVEILPDLPKTASGKILRRELRRSTPA